VPNIVHRFGLERGSREALFNAVATPAGIATWWTTNVVGDGGVGSVVRFLFGKGGPEFQVLEVVPSERVEWKCVAGPTEWVDTHVVFRILERDGEVILLFEHAGWREENEFMHHCSSQWAYFLFGLRHMLEGGQATPFGGHFEPISRWSK
jgi:uncharacterized protein YndB with AHSA1/START domain